MYGTNDLCHMFFVNFTNFRNKRKQKIFLELCLRRHNSWTLCALISKWRKFIYFVGLSLQEGRLFIGYFFLRRTFYEKQSETDRRTDGSLAIKFTDVRHNRGLWTTVSFKPPPATITCVNLSPEICIKIPWLTIKVILSGLNQCFPKFLLADTLWLRKITTDAQVLADVNIACLDDRYTKLKKIYIVQNWL